MRKKNVLTFFLLLAITAGGMAQGADKAKLEQERKALQEEIKQTQALYDKIKGQTKQSLGQLSILNRKINLQEQYINSINKELKSIDDDIYLSNLEIYRLQKQVDTLKAQYARTVVYAYKNRSNYDYLNFIFSANSFNDAIRRVNYLKSYRAYREKQVNTIQETQQLIAKRKEQQLGRKEQKNVALNNQTQQMGELESQKKEKASVVNGLKSQEKDLQKQLAAKKKRDNDLKNQVLAIVKRLQKEQEDRDKAAMAEAKRLADEENRKNAGNNSNANNGNNNTKTNNPVVTTKPVTKPEAPVKKPGSIELNAKDVALSADFSKNRGSLPWPVDNGYVKIGFGPYHVEGMEKIIGDNPGITIATDVGKTVKSVFNGEVVGVFNTGDGMAVTIKHGKYLTTYSNLTGVSVSKGTLVVTGQAIGRAGKDDEGSGGQIDFMLMIERNNVNPEPWLRR